MNASYADDPITTFKVTPEFFKAMIKGYNSQDKKKHRNTSNNITKKDYEEVKNMIEKDNCHQCHEGFTLSNKPTLNRQNNEIGHTLQNVNHAAVLVIVIRVIKMIAADYIWYN
jgi:hypothetical protein